MLNNIFTQDKIIYKDIYLILCVAFNLIIIMVMVGMVYVAKKNINNKFIRYLVCSICTVIIGFSGVYSSLYNMCFHNGYDIFKIDEGMSWKQVVVSGDFIYYSADCFLGTNMSNVQVGYIDYMDLHNSDKILSYHPDYFDKAVTASSCVKLFSIFESILFLVYISIIIMSVSSKEDEKKQEEIEDQRIKILYTVDKMSSSYADLDKKVNKILSLLYKKNK
jgi:hypothetical protein